MTYQICLMKEGKVVEEKTIQYGDPIHIVLGQSLIGEGTNVMVNGLVYETKYTNIDREKLAQIFTTKIEQGMVIVVRW